MLAAPHIKNALVGLEQARAKGATLPRPASIAELSAKHSARLQAAMVKLTTEATRIKVNAAASTVLSDSLARALKR